MMPLVMSEAARAEYNATVREQSKTYKGWRRTDAARGAAARWAKRRGDGRMGTEGGDVPNPGAARGHNEDVS